MEFKPGQWVTLRSGTKRTLADMALSEERRLFRRARKIMEVNYGDEILLENDVWYLVTEPRNMRSATEEEIKAAKLYNAFNVDD